jgi:hypothetical protein
MSSYSNNQILYGNYSLSNKRFQVKELSFLDSSPNELQTIPISRGTGSSVVRSRTGARKIRLAGGYTYTSTTADNDNVLIASEEIKEVFGKQKRFLRTCPLSKMIVIDACNSTTSWVDSDDATNITLNTTDWQYSISTQTPACVSFTADVSVSANNFATMTKDGGTAVDLSSKTDRGNFEFWVFLGDSYYVSSVAIRIGSSSSDYYSATITANYEGKPFENGWNYCSIKWGDEVNGKTITETGTVADNGIDYKQVVVNYSASAEDFTAYLGGFFWGDENFVRNYPCSLDGSVNFEPNWFLTTDAVKNDFELDLLNYTGYSISTHSIALFTENNITTLNRTKTINLGGNYEPLLTNNFKLNTITNLNFLEYENLNTNEKISWAKTWTAGDNLIFDALETKVETNGLPQDFTGKLPKNITGVNRLRMNIVQSGNTVNSQLVHNSENQTSGFSLSAQSFVAPISGTLTTASVLYRADNYSYPGSNLTMNAYLYSNSGSLPSAILSSTTFTLPQEDFAWKNITFNYTVVSGTTYWLVVQHEQVSGFLNYNYLWKYNSTSVITGNRARFNGSTWTTEASQDMTYILTFEPTPSTNIDWTCSYKKLYN